MSTAGVRRAPWAAIWVAIALMALPAGAAAKTVRGIDVSRFQGQINWKQVGKTKNKFVFAQSSRGSGADCLVAPDHCGPDPTWERNYEKAKENGLRVGAYHRAFASGKTRRLAKIDAREEARVFLAATGKVRRGDLRPVLDVETPFTRLTDSRLKLWLRTWLEKVKRATGVRPIIYTNNSSWSETGDTLWFARQRYKLWVANFDVKTPLVPADNWAGRGYSIWQFTSTGRVRGIEGNVDKNRLAVPLAKITARPRG